MLRGNKCQILENMLIIPKWMHTRRGRLLVVLVGYIFDSKLHHNIGMRKLLEFGTNQYTTTLMIVFQI